MLCCLWQTTPNYHLNDSGIPFAPFKECIRFGKATTSSIHQAIITVIYFQSLWSITVLASCWEISIYFSNYSCLQRHGVNVLPRFLTNQIQDACKQLVVDVFRVTQKWCDCSTFTYHQFIHLCTNALPIFTPLYMISSWCEMVEELLLRRTLGIVLDFCFYKCNKQVHTILELSCIIN